MVRSDSADDEIIMEVDKYDKYDDLDETLEEDFSPQPRWAHSKADVNRPHSRTASSLSPTAVGDPDRRLRRQIANCNERRRMQSINAGFQSLRALLPRKEGEKLSKAAILQQTADLIHTLQGERQRLLLDRDGAGGKKAKFDELADMDHRAIIDRLQVALERERTSRIILEQQVNQLREQMIYHQQGYSPASPSPVVQATMVQPSPLPPPPPPPPQESVIRPTPLSPITVDVSPRLLPANIPTTLTSTASSPLAAPPSLITTTPSAFSNSSLTAHRSLQTILDAIRHLEGGAVLAAQSPPPTSQATIVR